MASITSSCTFNNPYEDQTASEVVQERKQIQQAAMEYQYMRNKKNTASQVLTDYLDGVLEEELSKDTNKSNKKKAKPLPAGFPKNIWSFTRKDVEKARKKKVKLSVFVIEPEKEEVDSFKQDERLWITPNQNITWTTHPGVTYTYVGAGGSVGSGSTITTGSNTTPVYGDTSA